MTSSPCLSGVNSPAGRPRGVLQAIDDDDDRQQTTTDAREQSNTGPTLCVGRPVTIQP